MQNEDLSVQGLGSGLWRKEAYLDSRVGEDRHRVVWYPSNLLFIGHRGPLSGVKKAQRENDHTPPMTWCRIKHWDNFTCHIWSSCFDVYCQKWDSLQKPEVEQQTQILWRRGRYTHGTCVHGQGTFLTIATARTDLADKRLSRADEFLR
jgi:hypothetical protein